MKSEWNKGIYYQICDNNDTLDDNFIEKGLTSYLCAPASIIFLQAKYVNKLGKLAVRVRVCARVCACVCASVRL